MSNNNLSNSEWIRVLSVILCVVTVAASISGQSNGTVEISPSAITGGGNTTSNGTQSITGSIGQSPLGTVAGGSFMITGGLFGFRSVPFKFGDVNSDLTVTIADL